MNLPNSQLELQVGGAVPLETGVYISRSSDAELLDLLRQGEYCNVLCARQMGKTSTIFRVRAKLREEGFRTALLDIAGRLGTPATADDWYVGLLGQLCLQFKLPCDVNAWWAASRERTANLKLLAFFEEELVRKDSDRFVVFLDEIDHTINLPYTDDFFLAIRSLYNDRAVAPQLRRLAFCLVGVFTPNELVKTQRTTTYNIGRTIELEDFDSAKDDLSPLARTLSADFDVGASLLRAILNWTGGQPYLTASACKKVSAAGISSPEEVDRLVEEAFLTHERPLEDIDGTHFENIARFLGERAIARLESAELYRRILRGDNERDRSTPPVQALKLAGLVKVDRSARLIVRNNIYRRRFDANWAAVVAVLGDRTIEPSRGAKDDRPSAISESKITAENLQKESRWDSARTLFISHSSNDLAFVRELRQMLADHGHDGWIDSRELRGGDPLWTEIQKAIEGASAYAIVLSADALQSKWVGKELQHALKLRGKRGKDKYPVIPLSLNGTQLGVLEELFGNEPVYLPVSSGAGGIEATMNALLVASGKRKAVDIEATPQPLLEPVEELVLELTDLKFSEQSGVRRAMSRARLIYKPATPGRREVTSRQSWRLTAPLGPIEAEELRWYLEKFAVWPNEVFRERARKVEDQLVQWGRLLHDAALPAAHCENVLQSWAQIGAQAGRRFSVHVDDSVEDSASEAEQNAARAAATELLALPWELLHDGSAFLFQGAQPTRVRRGLPNNTVLSVPVVATPIRILLVTARPEDDACGYIDHRASALPLVEAMEALGGQVRLHILSPPTLPALSAELDRARRDGKPYHVLHFDGHGVYDRTVGLGGLCFEDPQDIGQLEGRRHTTVYTPELGALLRDHRVPLVFLEACQTALSEKASESVAPTLLTLGVASVVAMSHSVLVETACLFVAAFYQALARGARVGSAMLEGQRRLKDDTFRGRVFGASELRLEDWFVPVLFQEKDDPQLFRATPARQTVADYQAALTRRLGDLPATPATGFIGRSRELLVLQRLLGEQRYAVLRGQGGEGKTALAAEFARWMARSHQVRRAAFVSVETHGNQRAVVDALGKQLVQADFSAAGDLEDATQQVERVLREQPTLLVLDNMESILLPPYIEQDTPEALTEEAGRELKGILALCTRLLPLGGTRLVFTTRERLPAPFDAPRCLRELHRLDHEDAVKLVERALNADGGAAAGAALDTAREAIDALVDAVHGHARTLALLAPELRSQGVQATHAALVELMAEMERRYPGSREQSLFASVDLSLRRLSDANRDKVRVLGVFHGAVDLDVLRAMMEWDEAEVAALSGELVGTGLATPNRYNHLTLNPALCPALRGRLDVAEREALAVRWSEAMRAYVEFLVEQRSQNTEVASTLTLLELPNLFALLDLVQRAGDAEATINLATSLYGLLQSLGKPRLLERVGEVRDAAAAALGDAWNHAQFMARRTRIEQQLAGGRLREAFEGAQVLLQRARAVGEQRYRGADFDLAAACWLLARVLRTAGGSEQALPLLAEAVMLFEGIAARSGNEAALGMASASVSEQGACLLDLGRLDEAAAAYEEGIRRDEARGDTRDAAVGKAQLGAVRLSQRRYPEALASNADARERFTQLDEPGSVAVVWHQTGIVYQEAGASEAAEDAYRKSLAIKVRLGDVAGQARTLNQLGNLYGNALNRPEEAVAFYLQGADKYVLSGDAAGEGLTRNNLGETLRQLRRFDEARIQIRRAIECDAQFGHASEPWKTWAVLADIEMDAGDSAAAADAKRKAIASYLAYRRDGGENHYADGRISLAVTQPLLAGDTVEASAPLQQLASSPEAAWLQPFARAVQAIVAGSRDRRLADAQELRYRSAAEILFLIETLEQHSPPIP